MFVEREEMCDRTPRAAVAPSAFASQIEYCPSPDSLEREIRQLTAGMAVTRGHHESVVPGQVNDLEWNAFDLWHRVFVHKTYLESMNVVRGKHFAVQLTRIGRLPIYTMVANAKIATGLLYQCIDVLGVLYVHQVVRLEQAEDQVRVVIDWFTASHWAFRILHGFFNRRLLVLQRKQDGEDLQIRARRWELRKRGFRFATDVPDFINSNLLSDHVVLPALADPVRKRLSEIPAGQVERVPAGPIELLVERVPGGVKVWPGVCPHEGAALEACHRREDDVLHCPWHGRRFKAVTLSSEGQGQTWSFLGLSVKLEKDELVVSDTRASEEPASANGAPVASSHANGNGAASVEGMAARRAGAAAAAREPHRTWSSRRAAVVSSAPSPPPASGDEPDVTLFVACYNEQENIARTLDTVFAALAEVPCRAEVLVIDDASQDASVARVREYQERHPDRPVRLVVNEVNLGLAQNYIEGAFIGRGRYYRLICGDDVEPKETFVAVLKNLGRADMIIPYQVACPGRTRFRRLLSKTFTFLVNTITGNSIRYYNGLALHTRYNVMRWHTDYRGFGFQADLVTRLLDQGASYVEIPVTARERQTGQSKALTLHNVFSVGHMLLDLCIRRIGRLFYRRRLSKPRRALPDGSRG